MNYKFLYLISAAISFGANAQYSPSVPGSGSIDLPTYEKPKHKDCSSSKLHVLLSCRGKGDLIKYSTNEEDDSPNIDEIEINCDDSLHYGQYVGGSWTGYYHSPYFSIEIFNKNKFLIGSRLRGLGEFEYKIINHDEEIMMSNGKGDVMICEGIIIEK